MNAVFPFQKSPRCTATSKRTKLPCQAPAVNGWAVCRVHGARGGAPKGKRNGMYRHGLYTEQAVALNSRLSDLQRESRALLRRLVP
jgi:hypothetical protein